MVGCLLVALIVVVIIGISTLGTLLSYRDLDALRGKAFAQGCALTHARELLGRENLEHVAED